MKLNTPIHTFNSYGGAAAFTPVIALVELSNEDFGTALQEIELTLCFRSRLPFSKQRVDRSLRDPFEEFHEIRCEKLPNRRFQRKNATLKIEVLARFADAEDVDRRVQDFRLDWQPEVLEILISEMEQCRSKFKSTDDFRVGDFLGWLKGLRTKLPQSQMAAKKLDDQLRQMNEQQLEQMSEWDRLGIDWDDHHKEARNVVADPRLWSLGHAFSPNGNDTGADVFYMFRSEKARWARGAGKTFYDKLARDWGFDQQAKPEDSFDYETNRQVVLGLAFAFLKLFAYCPDWLAERAISEIRGYQEYLESNHLDWVHRDECLEFQTLMLDCLSRCPRK